MKLREARPGPVILWFRRDLRLADHPALSAAAALGRPVIAVFVHDETDEALGAAARFRLGLSLGSLARDLAAAGGRLILRRGARAGSVAGAGDRDRGRGGGLDTRP